MHSVSPVHIRIKNQLKNPMTATNFEDLIEKKKTVKIGSSTVINESKKPITIRSKKNSKFLIQKKKPVYQWTSPKKDKKCDLMKRCRLDDYISPKKLSIKTQSCKVCDDVKSRSSSRSISPEKNGQNNCSFLKRLSTSMSPVSLNRSQDYDPNSTYTMPNRSRSHESYLVTRENELLPIDENDLILKKEILIKKLIDTESFSSDIVRILELVKEYISNSSAGLDLKTVYDYLNKDIKNLYKLIDLFHLTHIDVRNIISEFLNPNTLSMLRHVKENRDILSKNENLKKENQKFKQIILEYERNISQTGSTNQALNMENNALANLKLSLEDNRAHLRRQLITREAECNRMSVQIRNLNRQLDRARMEIELLRESREKAGLSSLKFPIKQNSTCSLAQKQSTRQKSASTSNIPKNVKLEKNHFTFEEIISDPIKTRLYIEKLNNKIKEKDNCIKNLNDIIIQSKQESKEVELKSGSNNTKTTNERGEKSQIVRLMKENDKLKVSLQVKEERLKNALKAIENQKSEVKKSSNSNMSEMPKKNSHNNSTSEDASLSRPKSRSSSPKKSQNSDTTIQREKNFSEIEFNNVRSRLQQRLNELEPLPELLKNTELKLHEALSKIKKYEVEISENKKYINELKSKSKSDFINSNSKFRNKVQENELNDYGKNSLANSFNNFHQQQLELNAKQTRDIEKLTLSKLEPIERRIQNLEEENKELIRQLGFKDDLIRDLTNKLTVKSNEAASFSRQLDLAISDSNLKEHQIKEKHAFKERGLLERLSDLESKLRSMELHSSVDKRDKDDLCQEYQTQIRDLRYKLEQTQQANKQMQEYVHFLKNSYITYFNDNTLQNFDCTTNGSSNFLSGTSSHTFY